VNDIEIVEPCWKSIETIPINEWVLTPARYPGCPATVVKYVDGRYFINPNSESIITPEAWMPIPPYNPKSAV
jgi:hypothetical protein